MDVRQDGGQTVVGDINSDVFRLRDVSGEFDCGPNGTICNDATLTYVTPGQMHSFILVVRSGIFELYVDGFLVQTYTYGKYPVSAGLIGVAVNGTAGSVKFEALAAASFSQAGVGGAFN